MNASTQNLSNHQSPIIPFQPQTSDEAITAKVIRMMLNFEVLRVQLEGGRPNLTESQRVSMRQQATAIRTLGFRTEREARQKLRPILQKLAQNKYGITGPDGPDNSMMTLFDSIIREMFVILIRLPYLSLLQEALKKQSPPPRPADPRTLSSCSPMST